MSEGGAGPGVGRGRGRSPACGDRVGGINQILDRHSDELVCHFETLLSPSSSFSQKEHENPLITVYQKNKFLSSLFQNEKEQEIFPLLWPSPNSSSDDRVSEDGAGSGHGDGRGRGDRVVELFLVYLGRGDCVLGLCLLMFHQHSDELVLCHDCGPPDRFHFSSSLQKEHQRTDPSVSKP